MTIIQIMINVVDIVREYYTQLENYSTKTKTVAWNDKDEGFGVDSDSDGQRFAEFDFI